MREKIPVLVLGVGNILYTDEGIGVKVIQKLEELYEFSENVVLLDGGTLGMKLMDYILRSENLIIVDAVLGDGEPGEIYRLEGDGLRKSISFKNSLHQTDLVDTLTYCELMGNRPKAVVIGVEPKNMDDVNMKVSPELERVIPLVIEKVLAEIKRVGGDFKKKSSFD
ncbi:hydrogenase maturation protease [Desulfonauticus submarinus]|uniref:Hydrogenase maturation protease n=1 Tax=Desulfonauticus submarinus TaxID=206665 RepID=A0A1H0ADE9_9BACT|nr:HyaD/HybD family hydrogenase maturation endopeptidase [Desulfonauticus submarinus]SDN31437.1 hydrogenase maturation protease [Desulfonauticus submarinus]